MKYLFVCLLAIMAVSTANASTSEDLAKKIISCYQHKNQVVVSERDPIFYVGQDFSNARISGNDLTKANSLIG